MRISVIISTYNQPAWLEKSIRGFAAQTHHDFELVIADDGSTDETRQLIDRLRRETGLAIRHVWHEDHGFRKCTILNRATIAAEAEYLVFTDGDCIPRRDFLEQHARFAEPGHFLSGGIVRLPMALSHLISKDDILTGHAHNLAWLRAHGLGWSSKHYKLIGSPLMAAFLDRVTTTKATWNGGNASTWKESILRVNGFDERMEYGYEDRELGDRLMNVGLRGKRLRYRAALVHLDHGREYVREAAQALNKSIRRETCRKQAVWTAHGIVKKSQLQLNRAA
jgi:glycosyltransferase involved in cell wall biosynthesis